MSVPISNELFYAILAMDSYNRGYDAKLTGLSDSIGSMLGNTKIIGSAGDLNAQANGFYAIAYELDGKKLFPIEVQITQVFSVLLVIYGMAGCKVLVS